MQYLYPVLHYSSTINKGPNSSKYVYFHVTLSTDAIGDGNTVVLLLNQKQNKVYVYMCLCMLGFIVDIPSVLSFVTVHILSSPLRSVTAHSWTYYRLSVKFFWHAKANSAFWSYMIGWTIVHNQPIQYTLNIPLSSLANTDHVFMILQGYYQAAFYHEYRYHFGSTTRYLFCDW